MKLRHILLLTLSLVLIPVGLAQDVLPPLPSGEQLLYVWDGMLYAQPVDGGEAEPLGEGHPNVRRALPQPLADVHALTESPLSNLPDEGYGFYYGVWSADRARFAYIEMAEDDTAYRVHAWQDMQPVLTLAFQVNAGQGYLIPVAWLDDGRLLLLERYDLHTLHDLRLWTIDPNAGQLASAYRGTLAGALRGRAVYAPLSHKVFLGFQPESLQSYWFNLNTMQVETAFASVPPLEEADNGSVFAPFPVSVVGIIAADTLAEFTETYAALPPASRPERPTPFLHWPLPDNQRHITCYPDDAYSRANFEATCPGLSAPRMYEGHQGTDIGGRPNGLPLDTPVYPAAVGVVIDVQTECDESNPSCGDAYGNTVLMQHVRVIAGTATVWYSGYGHLNSALVEPFAVITDLTEPIALSGATGTGGSHLHFEVQTIPRPTERSWVNPWDAFGDNSGFWLWQAETDEPLAATGELEPVIVTLCTTFDGNNIRSGPGTGNPTVDQTRTGEDYEVLETLEVTAGLALGDWYRVRYNNGQSEGWVWSGVMTCREVR